MAAARYLSLTALGTRDWTSERHSLITVSSATGVKGLRRQRDAPSSSAILRKSGAGEFRFAKAYPDIAIKGVVGARSWNILIELEAAHVRHEDVDDHQVEGCAFQRPKSGLAAIGDGHLKIVPLKIDLNGHADHWVAIDDENTWHAGPPRLSIWFRQFGNP